MNADSAKNDTTAEREAEDGGLLVGGACNLATATAKHSQIATKEIGDTVKSKGCTDLNKYATLDGGKDCEDIAIEGHCNDVQKQQANVHKEQNLEDKSLLKERKLRQKLERELGRERTKRKRLEKLVRQARQVEEAKLVEQDKQDKESQTHFGANQERGCLIECQSKPAEQNKQTKETVNSNDANQDRGTLMKTQSKALKCDEQCHTLGNSHGANQSRGILMKQQSECDKESQTLAINQCANQGRGHLKTHQSHQITTVSNSTKVQKSQPKSKPLRSTSDDDKENVDPNLLPANSHTRAPPREDEHNFKSISTVSATPVNATRPSNIRYASSVCSTNVHQSNNLKAGGCSKVTAPKTCSYVCVATKLSQQVVRGKSRGIIKGAVVEKGSSCKQLSRPSASDKMVMIKGAVMEKGRNLQQSCQLRAKILSMIDEEDAPTHHHNLPTASESAELSSNGDTRQQKASTVNEEDAPTHHQRDTFPKEIAKLNNSTTHRCMDQYQGTSLTHSRSKELFSTQQRNLAQYKPPPSGLSSSCEHQCLACKSRLKCATVNSRNFVRMVQFDRFTCAYHRSIVQRLTTATNTKLDSARDGEMCGVCVREGEMKGGCINLPLQPNQQILPQSSCVCASCLHVHSDTVSTDKALSGNCVCRGGLYEQNDCARQKSSSELYDSKQSDLPLKRKTISQCGGVGAQCASVNVHGGSELQDRVRNVGGHCFCTVSKNVATPVKKRRVDGGCNGHDGQENEYAVSSEGSGDFNDSAQKQGTLQCSSSTNNQPDYRGYPSVTQHKATQPIDESSSSSGADSALHHPPESQNSDNSFNQSSDVSEVSDSSDPNWTPPSQNSSQTTDSSLYSGTAGVCNDSKLAKQCASPGTVQDARRNIIIGNAEQKRESEGQKSTDMQATTAKSSKSDIAPDLSNVQRLQCNNNTRPHAIYQLVAQPKKGKKMISKASSTFGALIDVTNRGTGVRGAKGEEGRKGRPISATTATTSAALTVFDYGLGTPAKPAGSKCRSNATGQLV